MNHPTNPRISFWVVLGVQLCLGSIAPLDAAAVTIHVPSEQPTIQAGIDAVQPGDTVLVAPGTYSGAGNRDIDFGGKNVRVLSVAGAAATIIDGEGSDAHGVRFHSGEGYTSLFDGFTIRGFRPTSAGGIPDGGGILTEPGCTPLIQNCVITGNAAIDGRGGGMSTAGGSVQYCLFEGNSSGGNVPGRGGGVYLDNATLYECVIRENRADDAGGAEGAGGGVATPDGTLNRCIVIGNRASIGGGLFADCPLFSLYLTSTTIAGNFASVDGGGIAVRCDGQADITLDRCITWGNGFCGTPDILLGGAHVTAAFLCSLADSTSVSGDGTPDFDQRCVFDDPLFCFPEDCEGAPPFSDGYGLQDISPARPGHNSCNQLMGGSMEVCLAASIGEGPGALDSMLLDPPTPNPATNRVRFGFHPPAGGSGRIEVFDVAGRLVRTLVDDRSQGGADSGDSGSSVTWDLRTDSGARVPAGVYFVRVRSLDRTMSRAMVVSR